MGKSRDSPPPETEPAPEHIPAEDWTAANRYLDLTLGKEFSRENVLAAVRGGTHLVRAAGNWLPAVKALKAARTHRIGDHLMGALDPSLDGKIARDLLGYLRHVAEEGVHMVTLQRAIASAPNHTRLPPPTRRKLTKRLGTMPVKDGSSSASPTLRDSRGSLPPRKAVSRNRIRTGQCLGTAGS